MSEPPRRALDDSSLGRNLTSWLVAGAIAGVLLVAAFPVYRLYESEHRAEALERRREAQVAMGHQIWEAACADCHGEQGEGEIGSPALNAAEFFDAATRSQVHHVIESGVPGTDMVAWWNEFGGPLTGQQINALVTYIYGWADDAPSRPDWRDPDPGTTTAAIDDGEGDEDESGIADDQPTVRITVSDVDCAPLDIEVEAGVPFVIEFENRGSGTRSLEFQGVAEHVHAREGEITLVDVPALDPRDYRFECLGSGHATVLGSGVVRAA